MRLSHTVFKSETYFGDGMGLEPGEVFIGVDSD